MNNKAIDALKQGLDHIMTQQGENVEMVELAKQWMKDANGAPSVAVVAYALADGLAKRLDAAQAASDILLALVGLKLYKDTEGKDAYYEAEQPKAWALAKEYLEHAMPEEYAIVVREIGARRAK